MKLFSNKKRVLRSQDTQELPRLSEEEIARAEAGARAASGRSGLPTQGTQAAAVPRPRAGGRIALLCVLGVLVLLCLICAGLGIWIGGSDTILPNVYAGEIPLGGLTPGEAIAALEEAGWSEETAGVTVQLPAEISFSISAAEAGVFPNAADMAIKAYTCGHGANIFGNGIAYLQCRLAGRHLPVYDEQALDRELVAQRVAAASREVVSAMMSDSLTIHDDHISIIKGAQGVTVDEAALCARVADALLAGGEQTVEFDVQVQTGQTLDLQALYESVATEPVDAAYDPETQAATEHVNGVDFDVDEARQLWDAADYGDIVRIPVVVTEPELTTDALNEMLFADCLGQKSTSLYGSSPNRLNNVKKAAAAIDGIILEPGERFSYNQALGQRTIASGYLAAGAYSGGEVVQEVGGGICQVSSTLYYSVLLANLEIAERLCHYFGVSYVPPGLDATVSWKTPDFCFVNNRDYPIRIEAAADNSTVSVKVWGTDVDGSYVQMTYSTYETEGGYGAITYRNVYNADGTLLSSGVESRSLYHYHEEEEEEEEPEDPENPENPDAPAEPTEPTEPNEPDAPAEPVEPSEPDAPAEPTEPTPPAEPVEPSEPVEPAEPAEPAEPTEPITPQDPAVSDDAA